VKKIIAIHQPNYLPWIGFFDKISKSDIFVIYDTAQYVKKSVCNKNFIKGPSGKLPLIVPVKISEGWDKPINEMRIDNSQNWALKHFKTLQMCYNKSPYFKEFYYEFFDFVYNKKWEFLGELNIFLIKELLKFLDIKTKVFLASDINVKGKGSEYNLNVCKAFNATIYLSGIGAKQYNDPTSFEENGIKLMYNEFKPFVYPQLFGEFIPYLSICDLLFNIGPESKKYFKHPK